jgi:hypothetical protein
MLNLITIDEDDDAQGGRIDEAQAKNIKDMLAKLDAEATKRFLAFIGADCVENILQKDYTTATRAIKKVSGTPLAPAQETTMKKGA